MNRWYTIGVITFVITFIIFYFFIYKNDEKRVSEHFDEEDKARFGNLMSDVRNAVIDYVMKKVPLEKRYNVHKRLLKFINDQTNEQDLNTYNVIAYKLDISNDIGLESASEIPSGNLFKDLNPSQILYRSGLLVKSYSPYISKNELTIMVNNFVENLEKNFPELNTQFDWFLSEQMLENSHVKSD